MRVGVLRSSVLALSAALLATVFVVPASSAARPEATQAAAAPAGGSLRVGESAWASVSVATVWRSPESPRPVDAPALKNPAQIERWLDDMTTDQRRALGGRSDTQVLLGDRVVVVALPASSPGWAQVVVPSQSTPQDERGYPGWVPRRQLTGEPPARARQHATVVSRLTWLRSDARDPERLMRISFGTELPVVGTTPKFVRVVAPGGVPARLSLKAVSVHSAGAPALPPTRAHLVRAAKMFQGLPYLWAGTSGFGFDCSGLTSLVYRVHGIAIPRDSSPQSENGAAAAPPRPGDLQFYATDGKVHHVSMYVGHGQMVHSPGTGQTVEVIATSTPGYAEEYSGARQYLP
ncbi:NlpC/P60 family protein [Nocardioides sp. SR21]|uniref:C40 family peptidase n=1 Tax=Nocardioides sp. SR21 TaxID=2919501 RepID=UPI001FA94A0A|nr:NlpC/P60 family protein [Nocardioides sp. SR21]